MSYIKKIALFFLFVTSFKSVSQSNFETLSESNVALNHTVSKKYHVNFSFRSRLFIYRNETLQLEQQQIDLVHFSTLKLNHNQTLSLGLQYRNRDLFNMNENEFRITEQFNVIKQGHGIRYGHRFQTEQRLFETKTIFRQRYRFTIDFPLGGQKLDVGEAYFIGSTATLLSLSRKASPEIDYRTTLQIGWKLSASLKLQTGLEYRIEAFNINPKNRLFLLTSAILKM